MTAEDVEGEIRRHPTMNERFLLGLLDEARARADDPEAYEYDKFMREHAHRWHRWEVVGAHSRWIEKCSVCNERREVS